MKRHEIIVRFGYVATKEESVVEF